MKIFNLPDLGEGLPDAIIRKWHVKVGDSVEMDQTMVSMETAKALVEVPAPFSGRVEKIFGAENDTIKTGQPLVGFEGKPSERIAHSESSTVVGRLMQSQSVLEEPSLNSSTVSNDSLKASPAVRSLARRLGVDLSALAQKGQRITIKAVKEAATSVIQERITTRNMSPLSPAQKAMALSMAASHRAVVPVTLSDEVDISAWKGKENITIRVIRAIVQACQKEPMLNATFDGKNMCYRYNDEVHLALAIDTPHGLYVPVLRSVASQNDEQLRMRINQLRQQAHEKTISPEVLRGGTIILSNFGTIAGRTANPIVVPPMTTIVGVGRLHDGIIAMQGKPAVRPLLPLSITVDHRAVAGGELARFLHIMMNKLGH